MSKKNNNDNDNSWQAFGKEWFAKNQGVLIFLLNFCLTKWISRKILCIDKDCPKASILSILPHCYTIQGENDGEYVTDYRNHWKFAKRVYFALKPLWWLCHWWDEVFADKHCPELSFGFDTLTAYSQAGGGGGNVTCDGMASKNSANSNWTVIRTGAGTGSNNDATSSYLELDADPSSLNTNKWSFLNRFFYTFNTSSLSASVSLTSVVFSIYGKSKAYNFSSPADLHVAGANLTNPNNVVTGDYNNQGSTSFGNVTYANFNYDYNDITLNSSGISNINITGVSQFSLQLSYDILNSAPTWGQSKYSYYEMYFADNTGTSQDPKLVVTYTAASTFTPQIIMF